MPTICRSIGRADLRARRPRPGSSTLADWVGKSAALLEPLADTIGRHVRAGGAIFADDTPVAMLAPGTGRTQTARLDLEIRLTAQLPAMSGKSPLAAAIRYGLARLPRLRPDLEHGILELDNSEPLRASAERSMRAIASSRKNYLSVGSEAGGRAAIASSPTPRSTPPSSTASTPSLARPHPGAHRRSSHQPRGRTAALEPAPMLKPELRKLDRFLSDRIPNTATRSCS
jgi:predicted component of type VI protein secretion system